MKLYRHYADLPDEARRGAVALGNFDGVHPGHRAVLSRAARCANDPPGRLGVVTFDPHPRRFFCPEDPPFQVTPLDVKVRILEDMGVDVVYALTFDAGLADLSPAAFVDDILVAGLGVRCVVTGADFRFGKGRQGTTTELAALAAQRGFEYVSVPLCSQDSGQPYASTRIRDCLRAGDMKQAAALLGRAWEVEGLVEKGEERGRQIGFPTANIPMDDYIRPALGVYAVFVALLSRSGTPHWYPSVANYGHRPTFGSRTPILEIHVLDYDGDLYTQSLRVRFIDFIRPEQNFGDSAALRDRIALDCQKARDILSHYAPGPVAGSSLKETPVLNKPRSQRNRDHDTTLS